MKRLFPPIAMLVILSLFFTAAVTWAEPYAFIPSYGNDRLVRIDTGTSTNNSVSVSLTDCDGPYGAAVAAGTSSIYVFVTCENSDALAVVDASSSSSMDMITLLDDVDDGGDVDAPRGVTVDPAGDYVYVANYGSNNIAYGRIDNSPSIDGVLDDDDADFNKPWGIVAIYDGSTSEEESTDVRKIYVTNNGNNKVAVITHTGSSTFEYDTVSGYDGVAPIGIAATPDGRYVYVANSGSNTVSVIRTSTDEQVKKITVGNTPWGVAVGNMGDYVYVTNSLANTVSIIDTQTNALATQTTNPVTVGTTPYGIAAPINGELVFAVNNAGAIPIHKIWPPISATAPTAIQNSNIQTPYALGAFFGGIRPDAPSGLTATATDDDTVELTWSDNSTNEEGFKIERRIQDEDEDESSAWVLIKLVGEDKEDYTDYNLSSETTYEYRICAYTEAADSEYNEVSGDDAVTTEESEDFSWCFIGSLF